MRWHILRGALTRFRASVQKTLFIEVHTSEIDAAFIIWHQAAYANSVLRGFKDESGHEPPECACLASELSALLVRWHDGIWHFDADENVRDGVDAAAQCRCVLRSRCEITFEAEGEPFVSGEASETLACAEGDDV